MLNAIGVPNPGVRKWATTILPEMRRRQVPVVASIWGLSAEDIVSAGEILSAFDGPIAWEINLSCPNSGHNKPPVAHDPESAAAVCSAIRDLASDDVGIWAKLAPDAPNILDVGMACHRAGADAVTVSNTYPAAEVQFATTRVLGGGSGGMSGQILRHYVRPLVEKFAAVHPEIPVLACGGVLTTDDAMDYLESGAAAIQVGTASLYDPRACHKIALGVVSRMSMR